MENKLTRVEHIVRIRSGNPFVIEDEVMIEEPLQISVIDKNGIPSPLSITMRTPGHDVLLAIGFMYNEGMIDLQDQITETRLSPGEVGIRLEKPVAAGFASRNFYMTSSCGVCGKSSIDALKVHAPVRAFNKKLHTGHISRMYHTMSAMQKAFSLTGGCHGAGVFDYNGDPVAVFEDVGRHNAVDKCTGHLLMEKKLENDEYILCLSGRSCYELIQKAVRINCTTVISIGAPTSLAIETAKAFNLSLIGFYKPENFNIYTGRERIV